MADIKKALRNIPEKQPGEESANEGQKGYLRSFGYFSEKLIKDLGVLQASYLIDQADLIKAEGSANIDASPKRPGRLGGFVRLILFLGVLALLFVVWKRFLKPEISDALDATVPKTEVAGSDVSNQSVERETSPQDRPDLVSEQTPEPVDEALDLASIQYPALVVTTQDFALLNKEGKETPIEIGTTIKIVERSELGTLKMEIGGELFVGNESRIIGKIKLKEA